MKTTFLTHDLVHRSFHIRSRAPSRPTMRCATMMLGLLAAGAACRVQADVQVLVGPTPIVKGDAKAAGDITVVNEKLAFALAVQSAVPYGVPRGALVDLAPVTDGKIGRDRIVFADFIPNNWSAWPNTYQHVEIVEQSANRAVVRSTRDWGKVTITTVYTLAANSDHIEIATTMTNRGDNALTGLLSGLTLWPNSGFYFAVPGMQGVPEGAADAPLAHRVVAYDEDWSIALHAGYFDHVGDESKDLYRLTTLPPGQSRTFEGWLQVTPSGDLAPVVAAEIERDHLASGRVRGSVLDHAQRLVAQPVVVVEKAGVPYAWVMGRAGHYEIALPRGEYTLYATAKNHSQSGKISINVNPDSQLTRDFRDLQDEGQIHFVVTNTVDGKPLDARIAIVAGQKPVVEFLGRRTFFTQLDRQGCLDLSIAPGKYVFDVSSGGGFLGPSRQIEVAVVPHGTATAAVALTRSFNPELQGWFSADLHHHADQAEAVTPPADLARSQLAAGLDLLFVSDHDSTLNHRALQAIADRRGVAFIPGVELSPSWGHFNAYPLTLGQTFEVDTSVATVDDIIKEARRQGAIIVQVNHPFIPYGYFTSVAAGVAPGGFNPTFDLIEMNASAPGDDEKVFHALWSFWNAGHHYYLSAGTDTHDVWNAQSGEVRMYAHVDGPLTPKAFAEALKFGHGYVSHEPLIFPRVMFGEERRIKPDEPFKLGFNLESNAGLRTVELIGRGAVVARKSFAAPLREAWVDFQLKTVRPMWYALVVENVNGQKAYSDPIWIDVVDWDESAGAASLTAMPGVARSVSAR
jgi:hypothetical protein